MRARNTLFGAALAACLASGCSPAVVSTPPAQLSSAAHPSKAASPDARQGFYVNPAAARGRAAPGVTMTFFDQREPDRAQLTVRPAELDLDKLPIANLPDPLDEKKQPTQLPSSIEPPALKMEQPSGWSGNNNSGTFIVEGKLARVQIGTVSDEAAAGDRVYRSCGQLPNNIIPARWMTLGPGRNGKVTLRVVDAWFDGNLCKASVVRATVIEPAPLLGGLVYAFRSRCADCKERDTVTFVTPPLSMVSQGVLGKSARVSHGSFVVARVTLGRGAAASFGGPVAAHAIDQWFEALGGSPLRGDAIIGVDVSHAVGDEHPLAIAYATIVRR